MPNDFVAVPFVMHIRIKSSVIKLSHYFRAFPSLQIRYITSNVKWNQKIYTNELLHVFYFSPTFLITSCFKLSILGFRGHDKTPIILLVPQVFLDNTKRVFSGVYEYTACIAVNIIILKFNSFDNFSAILKYTL